MHFLKNLCRFLAIDIFFLYAHMSESWIIASREVEVKRDTMTKSKNSETVEMEFGGTIGATALMIWSHYILFYFW